MRTLIGLLALLGLLVAAGKAKTTVYQSNFVVINDNVSGFINCNGVEIPCQDVVTESGVVEVDAAACARYTSSGSQAAATAGILSALAALAMA